MVVLASIMFVSKRIYILKFSNDLSYFDFHSISIFIMVRVCKLMASFISALLMY